MGVWRGGDFCIPKLIGIQFFVIIFVEGANNIIWYCTFGRYLII